MCTFSDYSENNAKAGKYTYDMLLNYYQRSG